MCGRYSLFVDPEDVEERFDATFAEAFQPRYNAAPGQSLPVVADDRPDAIDEKEWGFVPPWADDRSDVGFINARAETLADERPFAMAGLWAQWRPPATQTGLDAFGDGGGSGTDPETVETFTIVTTEPNDLVSELHHRMAVILPDGEEKRWLTADADEAGDLLAPYDGEMEAYPVSTAVNDPANDSPEVVEPVET